MRSQKMRPEATHAPGSLTSHWAWRCGSHSSCLLLTIHRSQTHGANLYLFLKDLFLLLIYCFWHLGKPLPIHIPLAPDTGFRGGRPHCPSPTQALSGELWPLLRGHYPGTFSLGWTDLPSFDHVIQHREERGPCHLPLSLRWALCSPGLICGNRSSCPAAVSGHSSLPWPELLPKKAGPSVLSQEGPKMDGEDGL